MWSLVHHLLTQERLQVLNVLINALMIDVDGVLINGRPPDGKPWSFDLEIDVGLSAADLHRHFFDPYWNDIVTGKSALEHCLRSALAKFAPHVPCAVLIDYWFSNDARLNRDLLEELGRQRAGGRKVYLATNQEHHRVNYLLDQLGLGNHVDGVYYSAAMGCRKPDPAFFEKAAVLSGFPPDQLLLVDDTGVNIVAARGAGWKAFEWKNSSLPAELAQILANDSPII